MTSQETEWAALSVAAPRLVSIEAVQAGLAGCGIGAMFVLAILSGHVQHIVLAGASLIALFAAGAIALLRQGGAIAFGETGLTLPKRLAGFGGKPIAYADMRGIFLARRGALTFILFDSGRLAGIPAARLQPGALALLRARVAAELGKLPDGAALIGRMQHQQALSEAIESRLPLATWSIALVVLALSCLGAPLGRSSALLTLFDHGAIVPALFGRGEWFRIVTASLLHATRLEAFAATFVLLFTGAALERLAGPRILVIVLTISCLGGQWAGAMIQGVLHPDALVAGLWPGIFGLAGSLSIAGARFKTTYPTVARATGPQSASLGWAALFNTFGHIPHAVIPGAAAGLCIGLLCGRLLCRGQASLEALRRPRALTAELALACAAVVAVGLGAGLLHAASPAGRSADRLALLHTLAENPGRDANNAAATAQAVAQDAAAPGVLLRAASRLAARTAADTYPNQAAHRTAAAALRVLYGRLDDDEPPADLDAALIWPPEPIPSYFARLLQTLAGQPVPAVFGPAGAVPSLRLQEGVITVALQGTADAGARLYAVVHDPAGGIAGMLFIMLPPGFSGSQILPLPTSEGAPSVAPPPPLWSDPATRLQLAVFDRRPCHCRGEVMGPSFYPTSYPASATP